MTNPMTEGMTFMGENPSFWAALKRRADELDATKLLREIADLHAKVGYYERRLDEIEEFRKSLNRK